MKRHSVIAVAVALGLSVCAASMPSLAASNDNQFASRAEELFMTAPVPASSDRMALARLAPTIAVTPVPKVNFGVPRSFGVFSSTAISAARLPAASKWHRVSREDYRPLFSAQCQQSGLAGCDSAFARTLTKVVAKAEGQPVGETLDLVNRSVNAAVTYRDDVKIWGVGDHWATPSEIAQKGMGDCEDYAIAKYWVLRSLGFSAEQLQVVVLQDTRRQMFHAVLVVHVDGGRYVLDNVSNRLAMDASYGNYRPIMSFAGGRNFIHGFAGSANSNIAAIPTNLSLIEPGVSQ